MIRKMNSSDFEKVYKLVCHLEETCFDLDKMKMIIDNDNLKITNYDHLKFTKNGKF